jgi:very-short-patch-repair endonuclease
MTDSEQKLWKHLRMGQVLGIRFYRQRPLAGYIVDFFAPAAKLIVEVDGSQHYEEAGVEKDRIRDTYFRDHGYLVLRFSNLDILQRTDGVVETVRQAVNARLGESGDTDQFGTE